MVDFSEAYQNLLKERGRLTRELEHLKVTLKPADERREGSPFGKREEEATEVMELEKRLALEKQLADSLDKTNHAIEKYEAGTYGVCDQCGGAGDGAGAELGVRHHGLPAHPADPADGGRLGRGVAVLRAASI